MYEVSNDLYLEVADHLASVADDVIVKVKGSCADMPNW